MLAYTGREGIAEYDSFIIFQWPTWILAVGVLALWQAFVHLKHLKILQNNSIKWSATQNKKRINE